MLHLLRWATAPAPPTYPHDWMDDNLWWNVLVFAALYEMITRGSQVLFVRHAQKHPNGAAFGGSYAATLVNACVCAATGAFVTVTLTSEGDVRMRALIESNSSTATTTAIPNAATKSLIGFLLCDGLHVMTQFPKLGSHDVLAHHVIYALLGILAYEVRIFPFVLGWMLLGEVPTIFLSLRWMLNSMGHGDSTALGVANAALTSSFFVFRVGAMTAGFSHLLLFLRPLLLASPAAYLAPSAPITMHTYIVDFFCGLVGAAVGLNLFWGYGITRTARQAASEMPSKRVNAVWLKRGDTPSEMLVLDADDIFPSIRR